jgi:hypothetical protein
MTASVQGPVSTKVRVNAKGYAVDARCPTVHGGTRQLTENVRGFWECQGCGSSLHYTSVLAQQGVDVPAPVVRTVEQQLAEQLRAVSRLAKHRG